LSDLVHDLWTSWERKRVENAEPIGPPELCQLLQELFDKPGAADRWTKRQALKPDVYRLPAAAGTGEYAVIVKRLDPSRGRRNQLVAKRWLPAVGLGGCVPSLLGIAAERSGAWVWHVYEDVGDGVLETKDPDPARLEAAVELIAQIHMRFAGHRLLAECRLCGEDFGAVFFGANLRDAIRSLEALRSLTLPDRQSFEITPEQAALRDRLLERLHELLDQETQRARLLVEYGGPETLLHGDLWTTNVLITPGCDGPQARLIDWDHVGVGPISYDLSTFLARFPIPDRPQILGLYRRRVGRCGWRLPTISVLNALFDTAECARLANRVIWPALAVTDGQAEWGFEELARVEQWLEELRPVLL
jgi:thiamine kinase-like enzyme